MINNDEGYVKSIEDMVVLCLLSIAASGSISLFALLLLIGFYCN